MDLGIEYVNYVGLNGGSVMCFVLGGKNMLCWGMCGMEDLGGGLKVVFNLESGIVIDIGKFDIDNMLFDCCVVVGLVGGFG